MPEPEATPPAEPDDDQHVCKPGASVYYCPTAGETESDCHGGFDVCCGRIDLHQQLVPCSLAVLKRPHNAHPWEPQPGMDPVHCEGANPAPGADQRCSCGGRGVTHFHADRHEPAPAVPVPGLRDQIAGVFRAVDGEFPAWTKRDAGPEAHVDAVMAVVQPYLDRLAADQERYEDDVVGRFNQQATGLARRAGEAEAALDKVREIDPDKLDLLADWFDTDDARKGSGRDFAVQADLRQWARTLRALTPPVPADQPEGGVG